MKSCQYKPHHGGYSNKSYRPRDPESLVRSPLEGLVPPSFEPTLYSMDVTRALTQDLRSGDHDSARRIVLGQRLAHVTTINKLLNQELNRDSANNNLEIVKELEQIAQERIISFRDILVEAIETDREYALDLYTFQTIAPDYVLDRFLYMSEENRGFVEEAREYKISRAR